MSLGDVWRKTNYKIPKQQLNAYEKNQYRLTNTKFEIICTALGVNPQSVLTYIICRFNAQNLNPILVDEKYVELEKNSSIHSNNQKVVNNKLIELSKDLTEEQQNKVIEYIESLKNKEQ